MKSLFFFLLIIAFAVTNSNCQEGNIFPKDGSVELKYDNGKIKEKSVWKNGLVVTRELYNDKGLLIEKHVFDQSNSAKGYIFNYFDDGSLAAKGLIFQSKNDEVEGNNSYLLYIYGKVKGYFKGDTTKISYEFFLPDIDKLLISAERDENYKNFNQYYADPIMWPERRILGLSTKITEYFETGQIKTEYEVVDGVKSGKYKELYENGNVKSEGTHKKLGFVGGYRVGKWTLYYESGIKEADMAYYSGGRGKNLKTGDLIGISTYYFENGKKHFVVHYGGEQDDYIRQDTLEAYVEDGTLILKYDPASKLPMLNPVSGQENPYEYSGKLELFHNNGVLKATGYMSNIPRTKVNQESLNSNACIMKDRKMVGLWYYFNEAGELIKGEIYNICGEKKSDIDEKEIKKIAKIYAKDKILDFVFKN